MTTDDRFLRLENALATLAELTAEQQRQSARHQRQSSQHERRIKRLEKALLDFIELSRSHSESLDELRAAQAESERKIAALADAQIRTEELVSKLAESHAHSDRRLDALIDIVREQRGGQAEDDDGGRGKSKPGE